MISTKTKFRLLKTAFVFFLCTLIISVALYSYSYSYSKNTEQMQIISDNHGDIKEMHRTAAFDILIDGKPENTVDFKAYATAKLSDIKKNGDEYIADSFLPDAYQTHTITVTNNSETTVKCILNLERSNNDDRVFYTVLPDTEENILKVLYTNSNIDTVENINDYTRGLTYKDGTLAIGESKSFTMIIWSEHDAVYPDTNNDGIADENSQKLSDLSDGVPSEQFTLNYTFEQAD